jgi:cation:H+ antiporter
MILSAALLIAGLFLLIKGGSWLVTGSSAIARRYGISELIIGLTIVAFGTSAPELVVSVVAAFEEHPEIALGNVIGSNNFNLFIILGISGIVMPLSIHVDTIRKEIPISLGAAIIMLLLANNFFLSGNYPFLSRVDGLVLGACFIGFLLYIRHSMLKGDTEEASPATVIKTWKSSLFIVAGLAGLIIGGRLVVSSSVDLARMFHVSEKIIGLTIVAIGTSLPELVTSLVALRTKNVDIAIGNVIGSNIFNVFLILGTATLVKPMVYAPQFNLDLLLLIFGTLLLILAMFTGGKRKLDRWEAVVFVLIYLGYFLFTAIRN